MKKTALRDVQNQNGSVLTNHQDVLKVCGTKRQAPGNPSSSSSHLSLSNNAVNEHILNARRRFDFELGRGRNYTSIDKYADSTQSRPGRQFQNEIPPKKTQFRENDNSLDPLARSKNLTSPTNSYAGPSQPTEAAKLGNNIQVAEFHKVSSEVPHPISPTSALEHRLTERFVRLQKLLKQCDDSYQRDYVEMLLRLSPAELSRHAIELEKRAIQLTIEEGKEMQQMKSLNILAKISPTNHPFPTA